ncbi:malto-oligosyltrehalose trehalohydrolase [Niastella caeni]|uniref:Malto-oligosyltrehalose trehalohydrolase n=1 Tax=Niastella caeni TaxID=2569763 RepID=A0A4S8HJF1_9BACT|nr:malto-oligosyltrehalose trehalohydrolase [Niastella caeni]THU32972.1 malto-oligosyltrehalose trehalohydrolase [Niastella caeni]
MLITSTLHGTEKNNNTTTFSVWAPLCNRMVLHLVHPHDKEMEMTKHEEGYWKISIDDLPDNATYFFKPDGEKDYPDPASQFQPQGVHGHSQVVNHQLFAWTDQQWKSIPLQNMILYELHVGTFTKEGTFEAIISRLHDLKETGINAIELMPVSQFAGNRNWGYDGAYPYAVQNTYGGPEGLKKLVDACHREGIAVILDVVYNHLGPEGCYFSSFGPYTTNKYNTPWGKALNFDDAWSDGVREYFSNNPLYWFEHFHIDGLRCDAIHFVFDNGAVNFWEYTHQKVKALEEKLGRPFLLIAESDLNSPKVVQPPELGGYGFDGQWLDDFHHALYVLLDEKGKERYYDFGTMKQLAKAFTDGFVHSGEWVQFRKKHFGVSSKGVPGNKFIAHNQNHDQIGNRVQGERLSMLVDVEKLQLAAAALLLSPYVPLLFMGEEYGEDVPFYFFVSHTDKELVEAVKEGRKKEFASFLNEGEIFPDPQAEKTFMKCKLQWHKRHEGKYKMLLNWHKELIRLRNSHSIFQYTDKKYISAEVFGGKGLAIHRRSENAAHHLICLFNLSEKELHYHLPSSQPAWHLLLHSKQPQWQYQHTSENYKPVLQMNGNEKVQLPPYCVVAYASMLQ